MERRDDPYQPPDAEVLEEPGTNEGTQTDARLRRAPVGRPAPTVPVWSWNKGLHLGLQRGGSSIFVGLTFLGALGLLAKCLISWSSLDNGMVEHGVEETLGMADVTFTEGNVQHELAS